VMGTKSSFKIPSPLGGGTKRARATNVARAQCGSQSRSEPGRGFFRRVPARSETAYSDTLPVMDTMQRPAASWPGRDEIAAFCRETFWVTALWLVVYGGASWIASLHTYRVRLWTDAELAIPFVPAASAVYLSLLPMLWLSSLVLRSTTELKKLSKAITIAILVSAPGFVLLPSVPAYPPHRADVEGSIFRFADAVNLQYNMCPSLHVAMAVAAAYTYAMQSPLRLKCFWWTWAAAITLSTLLTHQHHLIDALTGALVGWSCVAFANKNAWPR
jgi:membrane-associated phospholipid phosphatase